MLRKSFIVLTVAFFAFALTGCFSHNNLSLWPEDDGSLVTKVILPAHGATGNKILLLDLDGFITEVARGNMLFKQESTTFLIRQKLDRALQDRSIKGLIIRINSPGGEVNASDIIYQEILDYKAQAKVPVVAMQMGVAASGGYYISCAADRIVAHPTTITGSIGTIAFGFGFDGLFEKIGMESRVTKSGALKDMGNPFDKWNEEEKAVMQHIIDSMFDRFLNVVKENRSLTPEQIKAVSDGRIFMAMEAKKIGLVDRIGYIEDAVDEVLTLAQIRDANVIMYTPTDMAERNVYTQNAASDNPFKMTAMGDISAETLLELARPRVLYYWTGY